MEFLSKFKLKNKNNLSNSQSQDSFNDIYNNLCGNDDNENNDSQVIIHDNDDESQIISDPTFVLTNEIENDEAIFIQKMSKPLLTYNHFIQVIKHKYFIYMYYFISFN